MIVAVQLKRHVTGADVFCIVIAKFNFGKELCLVDLLKVDQSLEVGFYFTVLSFHLAFNLRIKGDRELLLNV